MSTLTVVLLAVFVGVPLLVLVLTMNAIEPGAYDPEDYVAEWHRKRSRG